MANEQLFSESDNEIRKRWLLWEVLIPGSLAMFGIIIKLFYILNDPLPITAADNVGGTSVVVPLLSLLWSVVRNGLACYIPYYCAYKNPGTIWLLLAMILGSLSLVLTVAGCYVLAGTDPELQAIQQFLGVGSIYIKLFLVLGTMYSVWLIYLRYRLREVNKKGRRKLIRNMPEYQTAYSTLTTTDSLEDLEAAYCTMLRTNESSRVKDCITTAFRDVQNGPTEKYS